MTDWDDGDTVPISGGFGGGFGRGGIGRGKPDGGFGFGLGRARGRAVQNKTVVGNSDSKWNDSGSAGGFGSSSSGSFGRGGGGSSFSSSNGVGTGFGSSSGGGGFGSSNSASNSFGTSNKGGGGFGLSNGGTSSFGSSNGGGSFGSSNSSGFGRSEDSDAPRGGGFGGVSKGGRGFGGADRKEAGGGGGGSNSCYKCGEDGHMARDCPSAENGGSSRGGGGSRACFKCGEEGHMSRECPSGGGRGGGSRTCYKCGEDGHMSRECPSGGGGGGGGSRACFKCGEEGHMSRECPSGGGGGGGGSRACFKCGEEGHMSRECPSGGGGSGGGDGKCFKCDEGGHFAKDCPNATEEKKREPNYIPPAPSEDEEAIFNSMQRGINFDKYDEIPVECSGEGQLTHGISTFNEADLSVTFRDNVRKAKYDRPTPVQKWAIPIIRKGRDLMACAQTGSGKTAAFLLPVLTGMVERGCGGGGMMAAQEPMALIIGPTRELVVQIYNEARKFSHGSMIRPCVVYGGTSVSHQLSQLSRGANMVIGTPGRLSDFISRGNISLKNVRYLILDEADRMLDMGFGPEVRKIVEQNGMPGKSERQTLMFSATFPEDIQRLAKEFLNNYLFLTVGRVGSANTDIQQGIHEVSQYSKRDKLVEILNDSGKDRVLVFVETKRQADFIASFLSQSNYPTTSIHGDRLQREREEALMDFKSGKAPILVATSVAARGLDIPGVKHVINYDLPSTIDEYVHRIGRTGRCGNLGRASSFFDPDKNADLARSLVKTLEDAKQEVPNFLETAAEMGTGTSFSGAGGKFGGRDARRGNYGGSDNGGFGVDDDFNSGIGGTEVEETWD